MQVSMTYTAFFLTIFVIASVVENIWSIFQEEWGPGLFKTNIETSYQLPNFKYTQDILTQIVEFKTLNCRK